MILRTTRKISRPFHSLSLGKYSPKHGTFFFFHRHVPEKKKVQVGWLGIPQRSKVNDECFPLCYHSIINKFHRFEKKRNVIFRYIITNKAIVVFEFNNTAKISAFSSLETHVALIKVAFFSFW